MRTTVRALFPLALLLAIGCEQDDESGDPEPDAAPPADVGPNPPPDADPMPPPDAEAPPPDAAPPPPDAGPPTPDAAAMRDEPGPVAPEVDPEPVRLRWMYALLDDATDDEILAATTAGEVTYPEIGEALYGAAWQPLAPNDTGELVPLRDGILYAIGAVSLDEGERLLARPDITGDIYVDGAPQPGDIYQNRTMRVPLLTRPGENLVVVRTGRGQRDPEVQLFRTTDELVFNFDDATFPELVAGDGSETWLGAPVLNLRHGPVYDLAAQVVENEYFEATEIRYPSISGGALTQIGFRLQPKAPFEGPELTIPVRLRLESLYLDQSYERTYELSTVDGQAHHRRTRPSAVDNSVQYYGLLWPSDFDPEQSYSLVLALHGAGVQAQGKVREYAAKDWTFIAAPTNRRRFGFDWEEWGRLDALETLEHVMATYPIDPTRVYLTGHSMGGHGTWHVGILHSERFATLGPSHGWQSYRTYGGARAPTEGPFFRASAASEPLPYIGNLSRRGVYVVHGSNDRVVPPEHGRTMAEAAREVTDDVDHYEHPGGGHCWALEDDPSSTCNDWPPLFQFMFERRLDPFELEFEFHSPSPRVTSTHSFVSMQSTFDQMADCAVYSELDEDSVVLTTENLRSLSLDGEILSNLGISTAIVDGEPHEVIEGPMPVGPQDGKRPGVYGPYPEVFQHPFCYVYPDARDRAAYKHYAAFQVSMWSIIGNGHGCALPYSRLTPELRDEYNLIYLGIPPDDVADGEHPFVWNDEMIDVPDREAGPYSDAMLVFVFPDGDRLSAVMATTAGAERLLYRAQPKQHGKPLGR